MQALVERATDTEPSAFRTVAVRSVVTCADLFAYASYDPTLKHLTKKRKQHSLWFSSKGKKTQFGLKRAAYFATKKVSIEFKNEKAKDLVEKVDGFKVLDLCGHLFQPKLSGRRRMFSKRVKASIMAAKPIDISKIIGTDARSGIAACNDRRGRARQYGDVHESNSIRVDRGNGVVCNSINREKEEKMNG